MTDPLSSLRPVAAPATLVARVLEAVGLAGDRYVVRPSAIGDVLVAFNDGGVSACMVIDPAAGVAGAATAFESRFRRSVVAADSPADALVDQIDRALAGEHVSELRYDLRSVTDFSRAVLTKAAEIPTGEVRPYGWIAAEIGRPKAVRAVGTALGRNPVPLLIPCHRVVRTDGRIGDYAFGSPAKRAVLIAEGVDPDELERLAARRVRYVASDATATFCHPTCVVARGIADVDRVSLASAGAALGRGFRPCRHCRPTVTADAA